VHRKAYTPTPLEIKEQTFVLLFKKFSSGQKTAKLPPKDCKTPAKRQQNLHHKVAKLTT